MSSSKKSKMEPVHAILAAAVLAVSVMPLATAGADAGATASKVTDAKFKKLKQRIANLEAQTGQAGGDLQGLFPNPRIREDAVGTDEVENDSLTSVDIADNAINEAELANNSVGTGELQGNVVGNSALKPVTTRVSAGAESDNTFVEQTALCNTGEVVLGGGYAWTKDASIDMVASAPNSAPGNEASGWFVRGKSGTNDNGLFAWVTCLAL